MSPLWKESTFECHVFRKFSPQSLQSWILLTLREHAQMLSQLQMVLLMHFVGVYSQTCYTECLKEPTGDTTIVNMMVVDAISDPALALVPGMA